MKLSKEINNGGKVTLKELHKSVIDYFDINNNDENLEDITNRTIVSHKTSILSDNWIQSEDEFKVSIEHNLDTNEPLVYMYNTDTKSNITDIKVKVINDKTLEIYNDTSINCVIICVNTNNILDLKDLINDNKENTGNLEDLNTDNKNSIVESINEIVYRYNNIDNRIGNLNQLQTTDKSSIVNALNEVFQSGVNNKKSLIDAINAKKTVPDLNYDATFATCIQRVQEIREGQGNALPEHVLSPYTFTNSDGIEREGTMSNRGAVEYTPTASGTILPGGYYDRITIPGDGDLHSNNILRGANIFGVSGNVIKATGNAQPSQVLDGVQFCNANGSARGTIPVIGGARTIRPTTSNQVIPAGYNSGNVTISGEPNLRPENIPEGISMFGVSGTRKEGFKYYFNEIPGYTLMGLLYHPMENIYLPGKLHEDRLGGAPDTINCKIVSFNKTYNQVLSYTGDEYEYTFTLDTGDTISYYMYNWVGHYLNSSIGLSIVNVTNNVYAVHIKS